MIYIKKNNQEAIHHVSEFLNGQWQDDRYINIDFDNIKSSVFRKYFLQEQYSEDVKSSVCCYCCKVITEQANSSNLEHIIPKSTNDDGEYNWYANQSEVIKNNVTLSKYFNNTRRETPPFPHKIAYQNLIASCDGKLYSFNKERADKQNPEQKIHSCNNFRKDKKIPPFNFIVNSINYEKDGTVSCYKKNDSAFLECQNLIDHIGINNRELKNIRRMWYLYATSDIEQEVILQEHTNESKLLILAMILAHRERKDTDTHIAASYINNDIMWNEFLKFRWFYFYYKSFLQNNKTT